MDPKVLKTQSKYNRIRAKDSDQKKSVANTVKAIYIRDCLIIYFVYMLRLETMRKFTTTNSILMMNHWMMVSGEGKFESLDNNCYPDIRTVGVGGYLATCKTPS